MTSLLWARSVISFAGVVDLRLAQWVRQPRTRTWFATLSLGGLILATASALLAIAAVTYAQIHHFPRQEPMLIRMYRVGLLVSAAVWGWHCGHFGAQLNPLVRSAVCRVDACILDAAATRNRNAPLRPQRSAPSR